MFYSITGAQEELAGWSNRTWLHVSSNFEFIQHSRHPSVGWLAGSVVTQSSPPSLSSVSRQSSRTACCALLRHPPRGSVSLAAREGERATLPRPQPRPPPPDHPPSHASAAPTNQPPDRPTDRPRFGGSHPNRLPHEGPVGRPASPADQLLWHTVGAKLNHDDEGPICGRS